MFNENVSRNTDGVNQSILSLDDLPSIDIDNDSSPLDDLPSLINYLY